LFTSEVQFVPTNQTGEQRISVAKTGFAVAQTKAFPGGVCYLKVVDTSKWLPDKAYETIHYFQLVSTNVG
jgi:hypothetical protein